MTAVPLADPVFLLCAVISVLVSGVSKGGFGGGLGILAVPLMALTVSPMEAARLRAFSYC